MSSRSRKLSMPVRAIDSAKTFGESMAHAARQFAEDVTGLVADRCGHWIPEERPVWLATQLINFFSTSSQLILLEPPGATRMSNLIFLVTFSLIFYVLGAAYLEAFVN